MAALTACGGDDGDQSGTPMQSAPPSPSTPPASAPTEATTELQEALAQPGVVDFLVQLEAAVEANDTQFFIDNVHYEDYSACQTEGNQPTPTFGTCFGIAEPPAGPGIGVGLWQSEGDTFTPEMYQELIRQRLSDDAAPDAYVYAVGKHIRGEEEPDSGVDVVIGGTGSPIPPGSPTASPSSALSLRLDRVNDAWRIVRVSRALVDLVPDFFEWWVPWEEALPARG